MTSAESTVKFAILNGLIKNWHKKNEPNFAEIAQQEIFNSLFSPHLKWAAEKYLQELSSQPPQEAVSPVTSIQEYFFNTAKAGENINEDYLKQTVEFINSLNPTK